MTGAEMRARAMERVGKMIRNKWRIDALLGVGGTAAVYAATHRNGKRAALKLLRRELLGSTDLITRFVREGYVANRLEHPGVVSVLDDDKDDDGAPFLVMELLEGHSLERYTRKQQPLPFHRVIDIGDQLLDVLATAHRKGVVHRDIKPANVFLQSDGTVKVLDFGIARIIEPLEASMTQTGTAIGTPSYMPPEQARGRWKLVDARTDVWAAGATLYALLGACKPRKADTVQEELLLAMTEPVPSLRVVAAHVPAELADIIAKAMEFDMNRRYGSAEAMQAALRMVAPSFGIEVNSTAPSIPINKRSGTAVLPSAPSLPKTASGVNPSVGSMVSFSHQPSTDPLPGRVSSIPGVSNPSGVRATDDSPSQNGPMTTGRPFAGPATMDAGSHVVARRAAPMSKLAVAGIGLAITAGTVAMFFIGRTYLAVPQTPAAPPPPMPTMVVPLPSSVTSSPAVATATASAAGTTTTKVLVPHPVLPVAPSAGSSIYRQR
jgi:eukaryotic-like serine/threonine-protein kinase